MLNFGWWRDKDNREGAVALSNVLKVAVPAVIAAGALVAGSYYAKEEPPAPVPGTAPISAATGSQVQTGDGTQVRAGDNSPVTVGGASGEGVK